MKSVRLHLRGCTETQAELPVIDHVFDNLHQFIRFCQTKRFLPEALRFIADDDNACMIVSLLDILAQLVESPIDVLLFAGEKDPTWTSMKPTAVFLEAGRRVGLRIDADRNQESVFAQAIPKGLLHLFEIPVHRWTNARALDEEGVDDHNLVL